jgi:hypothetical protein
LEVRSYASRSVIFAVVVGVVAASFAYTASADPPIGPSPPTTNTVTFTAPNVTDLETGQTISFTVNTSGTAHLIGNLSAHLCLHGLSGYGSSTFGYSGSGAVRCVYQQGIVSGGLANGADYEKTFGPYSGGESTSGSLSWKLGTGSVTWGNATGYGPVTLQDDSNHPVDLVVQVNLVGDDTPTTYFVQPLKFGALTAAGAPTAVKASAGDGAATVSWTKPASTGHSPITGYVVTPYIGTNRQAAHTFNNTATSQTITGLANKSSYTFKVAAKNAIGTGVKSAASSAIIVGAPNAPTGVTAAPGKTTSTTVGPIVVSFGPAPKNGSTITKYTAKCTSSNGGTAKSLTRAGSSSAPITITGATLKKTYTCTVQGFNARGAGKVSAVSEAITVGAPAHPPKPTAVKTGAGRLRVTFTAPASNGAAITSFTAKCASSNGGVTKSLSGPASPISITGLTQFKTYTCTATATNNRGTSAPSPASTAVNA